DLMTTTTIPIKEHEALANVYVVASRLRQFPVPLDAHLALVDAVDQCRSVLEPPVDDYSGKSPSNWQARVDAYPREEFLAMFRQAHATLHRLWTEAVDKDGYDKSLWKLLDIALARFARDAAEKSGISRTEPLL